MVTARSLRGQVQFSLAMNLGLSTLGFALSTSVMRTLGSSFIKANLKGIDLNKPTTKRNKDGTLARPIEGIEIPESQGTICATVYILLMATFIPFAFAGHSPQSFPYAQLTEYLAAVLTISFATFMGFMDDVLDLRWRHKMPLPFLATLPLMLVYHANGKQTGVMVPNLLSGWLGESLDLGIFFYFLLLVLAVFSTHAINIYAGVNGLEVGQSVIIGVSILVLNMVQLHRMPVEMEEYRQQHLQSLFLIVPFVAVSIALLRLNWWPSKVFVGDTYCYFAGMTFAVVAIVGHFSKTVVLLLIPQLLNFLYSIPQLFKLVPCPRHRLPGFDQEKGIVRNSYMEFKPQELKAAGRVIYWLLKNFRLAHVQLPDADGTVRVSNLTLINFVLYVMGPCREDVLCIRLLTLQLCSTVICFGVRFGLSGLLYETVQ